MPGRSGILSGQIKAPALLLHNGSVPLQLPVTKEQESGPLNEGGPEQGNYNPSGAPKYAYYGVCGTGVYYIRDAEGRKTDVIVPIDLRESLTAEKPADRPIGVAEPARYRGICPDLDLDLEAETRSLRNEWGRV